MFLPEELQQRYLVVFSLIHRGIMKVIYRDPSKGYLSNNFWVPKTSINVNATKSSLTFTQNTKDGEGKVLSLWQETDHHIIVPREFWDLTAFSFEIVDTRPASYPLVSVQSKIILDSKSPGETIQQEAVAAMEASRGGILQLSCGKGKTCCALELIARKGVPALVVVDNTQLMAQWKEQIEAFLVVPGGVGLIQADVFDWKHSVVLATYHTLAARAETMPEEVRRWFGLIVWDEAHHISAPTFSKSADLFYGQRIGLTATPERADGMHVVHNFHLGPILYRNLSQELRPRIYFFWTGLELDVNDPVIASKVTSVTKELHTGLVASYFGEWRTRLDIVLGEIRKAEVENRRVLVLSYSIAELVNLYSLWNGATDLYTDIQLPGASELDEGVDPAELEPKALQNITINIKRLRAEHEDPKTSAVKRQHLEFKIEQYAQRLLQHQAWVSATKLLEQRRRAYIKNMMELPSTAGLMIGAIKPEERHRLLRTKQVTFAIMKYGREGLDEPSLDTAFVCEPLSQKGGLQQLIGRVLRKREGKKVPVVVFFEDNIGPMIGMCQKLRKHLRYWPVEDGGPYDYELLGHPARRSTKWSTPQMNWT